MKNIKSAVLTALVLILVTSCGSVNKTLRRQAKCQKWGVCQSHDSTVIKETIRIDTIENDASEVWMDLLFECDSNNQVMIRQLDNLKTEHANIDANFKDNRLVVYVKQPSDTIYKVGKDTEKTVTRTVEVKTNVITGWQWVQMYAGRAFFVLVLAGLVYAWIKLKRYFRSL